MSETLGDLAPHFFQAGYVVREVDVAEEWFKRVMGVPSFFRMENVAFGEGCSYRGRPADAVAHLSIGYLGETQIELIESVRGPSIYTEFLERKGPGDFEIQQGEVKMAKTTTAKFLRDIGGKVARFDTFVPNFMADFDWHLTAALDFGFMWVNFIFDEASDRVDDHFLFKAESEMHVSSP